MTLLIEKSISYTDGVKLLYYLYMLKSMHYKLSGATLYTFRNNLNVINTKK